MSSPIHTGLCYTVVSPTPSGVLFVRAGYQIQAGDRAWQVSRSPALPDGYVSLDARTADWGIVWIADFAPEHLLQPPESVDYVPGCPQNPRPIRPDALTLSPAPPNNALQRTEAGGGAISDHHA